ncbi:MAG: hypothetical protein JKY22_08820 [Flavobacteriaceae bacterium]|nr:hypothetical protein [Flavobacteriaceae bacterium]
MVLSAQTIDKTKEVKLQIKEFISQKDILAVNNLLKLNTFLEPEYTLEILKGNILISKERENFKELADTYLVFGNFWFQQGNRVKAYDYFLKSESNSRKVNDEDILGSSMLNRGNITEDLDSRIEIYKEAITIFKKRNDTLNLSKVYLNIGDAYTNYVWENKKLEESKQYLTKKDSILYKETALSYYNKADSLNQYLDNGMVEGILQVHIGEWYKLEKDYNKAKELFFNAEKILLNAGYPKGQTYCILHLASIEIKQGHFSEALVYLKKAEDISKKYDYKKYLQGVYDEYVKVYDSLGNYSKALAYNRLYTDISLELYTINSQDRILALNLEHNLTENEYIIEKFKSESKLSRILITVILSISLLILGISYLIIKNKKRKIDSIQKSKVISDLEKYSIEIKLKNQQLHEELLKEKIKFSQDHLISFANQVNKIENFLDVVKTKIKELKKGTVDQNVVNSLKLSFSEIIHGQNHLKQLNSFSTQLNQNFFFYVRKEFPNITKEDEQLLSFIILDTNSKEISRNLSISTESVYTKRYRLRKKLNFNSDESFIGFYHKVISGLD